MAVAFAQMTSCASPAPEDIERVAAWAHAAGRLTLLVPRGQVRDVWRRALADAGCGLAIDVLTPAAWIAGLWELLGSGEQVVSAAQRLLFAACAVATSPGGADTAGGAGGVTRLVVKAARSYLPALTDRSLEVRPDLSFAEQGLLKMVGHYRDLLQQHALVEGSEAAACLAASMRAGVPASAKTVVACGIDMWPPHLLDLMATVALDGRVVIAYESEGAELTEAVADALARREVADAPAAFTASRGDQTADAAHGLCPAITCAEVAGPHARDAAYVSLIADACVAGSAIAPGAEPEQARRGRPVVAAVPDPVRAFWAWAPRLAARGISVGVDAFVPFGQTRPGEAFLMLVDVLRRMDEEEPGAWWPAPEVVDWLRSPFAGLGAGAARVAHAFDTHIRKARKMDAPALMRELASLQSRELNRERARADEAGEPPRPVVAESVIAAIAQGRYARALQLMLQAAEASSAAAYGREASAGKRASIQALTAVCALFEEARLLGLGEAEALAALPNLMVRTALVAWPGASSGSADEAPEGAAPAPEPAVRLCQLAQVAGARGSYDQVLVLDADAEAYPLARHDDALTLLAQKLDAAVLTAAPVPAQRALFRHALETGSGATLAYVTHDAQADERYAAFMYAELKDRARRAGALTMAEGLPDEGHPFANMDVCGGEGVVCDDAPRRPLDTLDADVRPLVLPAERIVGGQVVPRALSASQIENYLSCPYRWLVSNRVPTRRLDVGFGPIEMGNFVHDVMQRFHERLIESGARRVTPDNVADCLVEMERAFEEIRSDHARGKYTHGKYAREKRPQQVRGGLVALDELERNQIDAMLPKLFEVVRFEAEMLPIYTPDQFELSFDKEGVSYAGRPLGGRIDRIDVAESAGSGERFVVIDYKNRSSVSDYACLDPTTMTDDGEAVPAGWLPGRDKDLSPKVQTLIYATAYERLGERSAQGAVYLATRGPAVAGAAADTLVLSEPPAFEGGKVSPYPGVKAPRSQAKHDGTWSFAELLEHVEEGVREELDRLAAGDVAPRPCADSCMYCPFTMCEKRR